MRISGFSMIKNATKLYYPIKEAIASILPLVDEFVVALGDCDQDDQTLEEIESLKSDKIKIIHTVWDLDKYSKGTENAHQTDLAKEHCTGDWLFYLQADEVVHEKYLPVIKKKCLELLDDRAIEGLLFNYKHFWGDYNHYHIAHGWYPKEIRIIRNLPDVHSWESAQSFRRIPDFDYVNYRQQENTFKLNVAEVDAEIYHYGWVRPPHFMQRKKKALETIHKGAEIVNLEYLQQQDEFDYGPMRWTKKFDETHPSIMKDWIEKFNWADKLKHDGKVPKNRPKFKHEKIKYRIISFIEQKLMGGNMLFGFRNYILRKRK